MKHVIITSSDEKYGDFLVEHWLRSLRANVKLDNIDIAVLDYGLSDTQRERLTSAGVLLCTARPDGNITNVRYRDISDFLTRHDYDQVLSVDGGDIIFQSDISHLFDQHKDTFRAVCEEREIPFHDVLLPQTDMQRERYEEVFSFLKGKPTVNGGVVLGSAERFKGLWNFFEQQCHNFDVFGTDQLVMNYLLYKTGFTRLDKKYNFAIVAMKTRFLVDSGVFYDEHGEVIPIVHNAGMRSLTRCIKNFGYGKQCNKRKWLIPFLLHTLFALINTFKTLRHQSQNS